MNDLLKMVCVFISRPESLPFREPVNWEELGLTDYPLVVKVPMDLGTIKTKLEAQEYEKIEDVARDIRLVWSNCMVYNQDGSDFYHLASTFARKFEDSYAKLQKPAASGEAAEADVERIPSLDERIQLSYEIFKISNLQMAHVLTMVEQSCPNAVCRKASADEVMLNFDVMSSQCFHEINRYTQACLAGGTSGSGSSNKKRSSSATAALPPQPSSKKSNVRK